MTSSTVMRRTGIGAINRRFQRAQHSTYLDQVEGGVHLVGAVDRHVQHCCAFLWWVRRRIVREGWIAVERRVKHDRARSSLGVCTHKINQYITRTGVGVEGDERDAEALRLFLGADGGGDGHDVLQLARLELLAEALHCVC